jgi:hypothetical protein
MNHRLHLTISYSRLEKSRPDLAITTLAIILSA